MINTLSKPDDLNSKCHFLILLLHLTDVKEPRQPPVKAQFQKKYDTERGTETRMTAGFSLRQRK